MRTTMEPNISGRKISCERELNWMEKNRAMLDQLKGHWIVVEREELVIASPEMNAVVAEVRRRGIRAPLIVYVPEQQQTHTVNLF